MAMNGRQLLRYSDQFQDFVISVFIFDSKIAFDTKRMDGLQMVISVYFMWPRFNEWCKIYTDLKTDQSHGWYDGQSILHVKTR